MTLVSLLSNSGPKRAICRVMCSETRAHNTTAADLLRRNNSAYLPELSRPNRGVVACAAISGGADYRTNDTYVRSRFVGSQK